MDKFLWVVWLNDISWCIEILVSFFVASDNDKTFKDTSLNYLKGFFVLDVLATLPPMITNQKIMAVNMLKFLRFSHLFEMFEPFEKMINCCCASKKAKQRGDMHQLIVVFSASLLFGHIASCLWIAIGTSENGWLTLLQTASLDDGGDPQFKEYGPEEVYVFALYWVFTVLTTVGYGDYAGYSSSEFVFTIGLEFCGLTFFALLTGLIAPLVTPEKDYQGMLMEKTGDLDIWIKKLQEANSTTCSYYLPATLYLSISETV